MKTQLKLTLTAATIAMLMLAGCVEPTAESKKSAKKNAELCVVRNRQYVGRVEGPNYQSIAALREWCNAKWQP